MDLTKTLFANLYYYGTLGLRSWRLQQACAEGRAPIAILAFHRVADDRANAWTTPTAVFKAAIRWLADHVDLISLEDAQRRIQSGINRTPSVCITFDDGYAENFDAAIPMMVDYVIPCTYFVTVGPVVDGHPFEHDVAVGHLHSPNTIEQLRGLGDTCVEVGAHTRTHPDLAHVDNRDQLIDEIVSARDELEHLLERRVRYFAFPFGQRANLTAQAVQLAREAGYEAVCSAYGGYNLPGDDPFHLRRRCLDGPLLRIKNWVTVDPFRNRKVPEFVIPDGLPEQTTQLR